MADHTYEHLKICKGRGGFVKPPVVHRKPKKRKYNPNQKIVLIPPPSLRLPSMGNSAFDCGPITCLDFGDSLTPSTSSTSSSNSSLIQSRPSSPPHKRRRPEPDLSLSSSPDHSDFVVPRRVKRAKHARNSAASIHGPIPPLRPDPMPPDHPGGKGFGISSSARKDSQKREKPPKPRPGTAGQKSRSERDRYYATGKVVSLVASPREKAEWELQRERRKMESVFESGGPMPSDVYPSWMHPFSPTPDYSYRKRQMQVQDRLKDYLRTVVGHNLT